MLEKIRHYNVKKPPMRMHLRWLIGMLVTPSNIIRRNRLTRIGMEGIKPPYLLLCNHNAFTDFMVATKATWPRRVSYVVAIDGFIGLEWIMRVIGCICTRKFTSDMNLVRQLSRVIKNGDIAAIYPEARYSLCGTTAVLPDSIGKLAKLLKVPVVTLMCHGHHVNSPFWNTGSRGLKGTEAELKCIADADDVARMSADELNVLIRENFVYDDFRWQREKGKKIKYKKRAEGLHKVLYQCPSCGTEYRMSSKKAILRCDECGKEWEMTELGELRALSGETEFSHIPDWYEWERANVRAEVERGEYSFSAKVRVDTLPNSRGYIDLGMGELTHNADGFRLTGCWKGENYEVVISAPKIYSCHIEYEYKGKGDCIDLNTATDTYYIYPKDCEFAVTKIALATEELYEHYWRQQKQKKLPEAGQEQELPADSAPVEAVQSESASCGSGESAE